MQALALLVRTISGLNRAVGEVLSWLALGCVLVCFTVVVQRYAFSVGHLFRILLLNDKQKGARA